MKGKQQGFAPHGLFPVEGEDESPEVDQITLLRWENGRQITYPRTLAAAELPDAEALYSLCGGGLYEVQAKGANGRITARRKYELQGDPKPFNLGGGERQREPVAHAAPMPPQAGGQSMNLEALFTFMMTQQQQQQQQAREEARRQEERARQDNERQQANMMTLFQAMTQQQQQQTQQMTQLMIATMQQGSRGGTDSLIQLMREGIAMGLEAATSGGGGGDEDPDDVNSAIEEAIGQVSNVASLASLLRGGAKPQSAPSSAPAAPTPPKAAES